LWITFLHIAEKIDGYYWERIWCWTFNHKQFFFLNKGLVFNKGLVMCDENNFSSRMWLCYKNINCVLGFSCYSRLYSILWLWMSHIVGYWMKIGLLCLLFTFLISLYWEKRQWIKSKWRAFDNSQDMLLYFPRWVIICIYHISLISLSTNWLSVVGLLHKRVIDSFIIPIAPIIKCTWHGVHWCNHFLKFSCT